MQSFSKHEFGQAGNAPGRQSLSHPVLQKLQIPGAPGFPGPEISLQLARSAPASLSRPPASPPTPRSPTPATPPIPLLTRNPDTQRRTCGRPRRAAARLGLGSSLTVPTPLSLRDPRAPPGAPSPIQLPLSLGLSSTRWRSCCPPPPAPPGPARHPLAPPGSSGPVPSAAPAAGLSPG